MSNKIETKHDFEFDLKAVEKFAENELADFSGAVSTLAVITFTQGARYQYGIDLAKHEEIVKVIMQQTENAERLLIEGETIVNELIAEIATLKSKLNKAVSALKNCSESFLFTANLSSEINVKIHGDLYGCDCEGGCSCKPEIWIELEKLKYHNLGSDVSINEVLKELEK